MFMINDERMTTSRDLSVDELLSLQENQYQLSNILSTNVKPIGAERKIGQFTNTSETTSSLASSKRLVYPMNINSRDKLVNDYCFNSFEMSSLASGNSSTKPSIYGHAHFSSTDGSLAHHIKNALESSTHHPYYDHSLTTDYPTIYLPRSPPRILDDSDYQRRTPSLVPHRLHPSMSARSQTVKAPSSFRVPPTYPSSRFPIPHSFQHNSRHPLINISQQSRTIAPIFTAPFQCTRERFQVNSIGRPILRANTYHHFSQVHGLKLRR